MNIFEDGRESRDFVYIDDVANATILGLENDQANFNVYNVGTGEQVNVLQIAHTLVNLYRSAVSVNVTGNFRMGDIRHNYADLTKIRKDLNFRPEYQFEQGMSKFVEWVNSQEVEESKYLNSIKELKERGLLK